MAHKDQAGPVPAPDKLSAEQVAHYLSEHPEFFTERPELAEQLAAQHGVSAMPDGVVDMRAYMVGRLRGEVDRLKQGQQEIIGASRANETTLQRVHTAVLFLLDARSFEELIQTVTADLAVLLDIDVVALLVESADDGQPPTPAGVRVVDDGFIDHCLGDQEVLLDGGSVGGEETIFGPAANLVRSQALVRLSISPDAPPCMLALGSRDPEVYAQGMRTDLIAFLARVMERVMRSWLDLAS